MCDSMFSGFSVPTPVTLLSGERWQQRVWMKKEYLRDDELGGNKWCKLLGHLDAARRHGYHHVVSVGGSWSNHLHALALAGRRFGFSTTGLVRGEPADTDTLRAARAAGMHIEFISREDYRLRNEPGQLERMARAWQPAWLIPEGGQGGDALVGLSSLAKEIELQIEGDVVLVLPVGSGTTLAGLVAALPARFRVWGFQVFHDSTLVGRIKSMLPDDHAGASWQLWSTQDMRSHRRLAPRLSALMQSFEREEGVPLDPVYTVRMMDALGQLADQGGMPSDSRILALHTGGLQGRRGHGLALAA